MLKSAISLSDILAQTAFSSLLEKAIRVWDLSINHSLNKNQAESCAKIILVIKTKCSNVVKMKLCVGCYGHFKMVPLS